MSPREGSCLCELTEFLYLGSFAGCKELDKYGITYVLNMAKDIAEDWYEAINIDIPKYRYFKMHLRDDSSESIAPHFDECFRIIEQARSEGKRILVHCIGGVSRSATVCIAYLMKHHSMNLEEAHAFVKTARPVIQPNFGFWKQLVEYELRLHGTSSMTTWPGTMLSQHVRAPALPLLRTSIQLRRAWRTQPLLLCGVGLLCFSLLVTLCFSYS